MKRLLTAPLILAAVLFSGCTYTQHLGDSFYLAPGSSEVQTVNSQSAMFGGSTDSLAQMPSMTVPLKIGVVKGEPFKSFEGGHCMGWIGQPYVETKIEGDYEAGFITALSNYFQSVTPVDTMDPKAKVDLFVKVDRTFPDSVGLSFYDPKSKALLQDIREPFDPDPSHILTESCDPILQTLSCLFWDTVAWDIMFPVYARWVEQGDYKRMFRFMKARLSNKMSLIAERASQSPVLRNLEPAAENAPGSSRQRPAESAPEGGQQPWWKQQ
jgi:hypothetical protein